MSAFSANRGIPSSQRRLSGAYSGLKMGFSGNMGIPSKQGGLGAGNPLGFTGNMGIPSKQGGLGAANPLGFSGSQGIPGNQQGLGADNRLKVGFSGNRSMQMLMTKDLHTHDIEPIAVNDPTSTIDHTSSDLKVKDSNTLLLDDMPIAVLGFSDHEEIPWGETGAEVVIDSTDVFAFLDKAKEDKPYSIVPALKVLADKFKIVSGHVTTLFIVKKESVDEPDAVANSPGYAKVAAGNGIVLLALNGKSIGLGFHVPTAGVSMVDISVKLEKEASYDEIKDIIKDAAKDSVSTDSLNVDGSNSSDAEAEISITEDFEKLLALFCHH